MSEHDDKWRPGDCPANVAPTEWAKFEAQAEEMRARGETEPPTTPVPDGEKVV